MSPKSLQRGQDCRGPGAAEEATAKVRGTWEIGGIWYTGPQGLHIQGNGLRVGQAGPRTIWHRSCSASLGTWSQTSPHWLGPTPSGSVTGVSPQPQGPSPPPCWTPPADRCCPGTRCGWDIGLGQLEVLEGPAVGAPLWGSGELGRALACCGRECQMA